MTLDPTILRESFDLIIDRRPDLTICFYEVLCERYPALAPMFRRDRTAQARMLAGAIAAVLDHLEDARWLETTLGDLGAAHESYGVTPLMYDQFGEALIVAFARVAAEAWSPTVAEQWSLICRTIAGLMQPRGAIAKAA